MQNLTNRRGSRASNIEALRIIAMFLVLLVHADFFAIGQPTHNVVLTQPIDSTIRILVENISIVCVNVFVLISGWFGIRPKVRSVANFLFQCLFFLVGIYAVMLLTGLAQLSTKGIAACLFMTPSNWFVKAYLVLYILSPALNAFLEHCTKRQAKLVIIFYLLFQSVYGWLTTSTAYFSFGYSPLHFIGLYLLARYAAMFHPRWSGFSLSADISIYIALTLLNTIATILSAYVGEPVYNAVLLRMTPYSSPIVIAAAMFMLLAFSKIKLQSKVVNWFAASSFAAYLLHTNPNIINTIFQPLCQYLREMSGTAYFAVILPVLAAIFVESVLIDKVRIWTWHKIEKPVTTAIETAMQQLK